MAGTSGTQALAKRWIPKISSASPPTHSIVGTNLSAQVNSDTTNGVQRATVTAGNLLIVCAKWEDAAGKTLSVTNSSGDTFTVLSQTNFAGNAFAQMAYAKNVTGGSNVKVVCKWSDTVFASNVILIEVAGCSATAPLDGEKVGAGASTAASTATLATAQAEEVLVTVIGRANSGTVTPQASWTEVIDTDAVEVQWIITSSTGTYNGSGTISSSQNWAETFAAFK